VSFAPRAMGPRGAALTISSTAPDSPHTVPLAGIGTAPMLSITPLSIDFGNEFLGITSPARMVSLTNIGTADLHISEIILANGPPPGYFEIIFDDCLTPGLAISTLPPAGRCNIGVTFLPRSVGPTHWSLLIGSDDDALPHDVPLTGVGVFPPSPFVPPPVDDHTFLWDGTKTLCALGSIEFGILVTRYVGAGNPDGTLLDPAALAANRVVSTTATLEMPAYNVNSPAPTHEARLRVTFNGVDLGFLTGRPAAWALDSFAVPIGAVRFPGLPAPGAAPTPAINTVRIDVDTTDEGWCTAIDWGKLRFRAMSPVIMIHGWQGSGRYFDKRGFKATFDSWDIPNDNSISMSAGGDASVAANAAALDTLIPPIVRRFGVDSAHLIAHSKGGLDSRAWLGTYARSHSFRILSLTTLSTPHAGSSLADLGVAVRDVAGVLLSIGIPGGETYPDEITALIPNSPGLQDLTTSAAATFRPSMPAGAHYRMVGADADRNGNGLIQSSPIDEYAAARDDTRFLADLFALDPPAADALATFVHAVLSTVSSVSVATIPIVYPCRDPFCLIPIPRVETLSVPVVVFGGGPNDLMVTIRSANSAGSPFISLPPYSGGASRNHASIVDAGVAAQLIPLLQATEASIGDFR